MRSVCAFIVGASLLVAAEALPQTFDLEKALALPVSPGAIALLVEHTKDDRVRARLAEHLKDAQSEVRAAASRVVHAASVQALVPNVSEALERETDADAATEMVMAVIGYAESERAVLEAARRLHIGSIAAPALAAGAGSRALDYLDVLRGIEPSLPLAPVLRIASRDDLAALAPVAAKALREPDLVLWKVFLEAARESKQEASGAFLSVGVTLKDLRSATLWHALASGAKVEVPPETVLDGEEEFLVELLARREGRKPRESKAWIAARTAGEETPLSQTVGPAFEKVLLLLTKSERRALSSQIRKDPKSLDHWYELVKKAEKEVEKPEGPITKTAALRTVSDFPDGFVRSVLGVTGCQPEAAIAIGAAEVDYSLAGRPVRIRFPPSSVETEGCGIASRVLVLTSAVPPHSLSAKADSSTLLVLHEPDFISCLSEARPRSWIGGQTGAHPKGAIEPPKKIRDVHAVYPRSAAAERIEGEVVVDALITSSGCVRNIRTVRSPDSRLTLAAIVAVSRWRFEPARLGGTPVAMVATFNVTFSIE